MSELNPAPCIAATAEPADGHTRYRVSLSEWNVYSISIDAPSAQAAEEYAQVIWISDDGLDLFKHRNCGFDAPIAEVE